MSAEIAARRIAAEAVLSDFQRETGDNFDVGWRDWQTWALRLGQHLQFLLEANGLRPRIDGSMAASGVLPDGSAALSPADLVTVLNALTDAAGYRGNSHGSQDRDREQATAYRALAYRLGDDR